MEFLHYSLGYLERGKNIQVSIEGTECDVLLLDNINLLNYKFGKRFSYYGGHYKYSPVTITIPYYGQWNLVIANGRVKVSVKVI